MFNAILISGRKLRRTGMKERVSLLNILGFQTKSLKSDSPASYFLVDTIAFQLHLSPGEVVQFDESIHALVCYIRTRRI